ncbi:MULTISPECIES: helix-turn-helix domain-containing protein [Empedobacter]|uniref:Transcriptional regulator, y4mF family n=1 Tax=Empedobacter falsenii TaxID=343874 RepID=A0A376GHS5_9FLAO|nr:MULTISPECIES: helix-turn-helix transcriptional regulator [Empedobacter]MDM1139809.1 helix-turn-helix transcriptional regulator [Empedobacter sp. R132-2]STD58553.1 transcriptional regulator, y4mF family [Empedobacter falsenii]
MTEKEKLGIYLTSLRKDIKSSDYIDRSISQQELADKTKGLSKNTLLSIENGSANPTLDSLIILANALNQDKLNIFNISIDVKKYIKENNLDF